MVLAALGHELGRERLVSVCRRRVGGVTSRQKCAFSGDHRLAAFRWTENAMRWPVNSPYLYLLNIARKSSLSREAGVNVAMVKPGESRSSKGLLRRAETSFPLLADSYLA